MNKKISIALLTGGYSEEREISLKSAAFVESQLDKDKYLVYKIIVDREDWWYKDGDGHVHPVERNDFSLKLDSGVVYFDLAFIMIHGSPGEDGSLQGYLELIGISSVSCNAATLAITMNKAYTKAVLTGIEDLYLARSVHLFSWQRGDVKQIVEANLKFPCFVKPACGGSSIAMAKVETMEGLLEAVDLAFNVKGTDNQVLVEEYVKGREFSVGIYRRKDGLCVLPATEITTTRDYFDYEAKYNSSGADSITPAELTSGLRTRIERLVTNIYQRLNCKGMVRVDFFIEKDTDRFYFIEINTIPGQTDHSFIPRQAQAAGLSVQTFYNELIEMAM